jgi:glycopeptide antibiotics resistance protein
MHFVESTLPWLPPGTIVFAIIGIVVCRRLARALGTRPAVAWLLVVSVGIIVSATLTPLYGTLETTASGPGACDLSVMGFIPLRELFQVDDRSLNILLFIPLGVALGLLPRSRRTAFLVLAAVLFPFAIETTQLLAPILGRGCQSIDVIDNLTGLAIGLAAGATIGWLVPAVRLPSAPPGS